MPSTPKLPPAPAEFKDMIAEFHAAGLARGVDLLPKLALVSFEFSPDPDGGRCIRLPLLGGRTVQINPAFWNSNRENNRRALLFHELGHCVLDLDHDQRLGDGYRPVSLMFSAAGMIGDFWVEHGGEYLDQLFSAAHQR